MPNTIDCPAVPVRGRSTVSQWCRHIPAARPVFAFTSCARFSGRFELSASKVRAIVDCEGLTLAPGESWTLEEMMVSSGGDHSALLGAVADRLARNHPPLRVSRPPTGWCSWYCFGPNVTATQVLDNLDIIARNIPALKYIQIDDGYQRAMGDWLETGSAFGGSVRTVLSEIRKRGFEPAIWVAPFIAEADSHRVSAAPGLVHQGHDRCARCARIASRSAGGGTALGTRSTARIQPPQHISNACSARCATSGAAPTSSSMRTSGARCMADVFTIRTPRGLPRIAAGCRQSCVVPETAFCSVAIIRSGRRSG
jgi:hypothetical protein